MATAATARHSIGVVSRRTGLKPDLIRAWERRYGAVEPARSEGRHRLYSDAEVERLALLREAVEGGRNIGDVATRSNEELEELIAGDRAAAFRPPGPVRRLPSRRGDAGDEESAEAILETCLAAVRNLDTQELELSLERGVVALSRFKVLLQVVVPLMQRIGELWHQGELRPLHEHLASGVVRTFVGALRSGQPPAPGAPRLLVTTPARQRHELGALIAATCAAEEGWAVTYLGADLPAEEIAAAAHRTEALAVALSITYPPDDPALRRELESLGRLLPEGTRLLVGGRSAGGYEETLQAVGARRVEDVPALRRELARLRSPSG